MLGTFLSHNRNVYCLAFLPLYVKNRLDETDGKQELLPGEIGFAKVKKVFEEQENGRPTPELQSIMNTAGAGIFVGLLMGGVLKTRDVKENFIKENQGTKFYNEFDAKRQLQNKLFVEFLKGGAPFAMKLGLFSLIFGGVTTCYGAYTGQIKVRNYVLGGLTAGMIFRINMGIRGMLSGGFLGSMLGAICGITSVFILYINDVQMSKIYETQQKWADARHEKVKESLLKAKAHSVLEPQDNSTETLLELLSGKNTKGEDEQALEKEPQGKTEKEPQKNSENEPEIK